MIFFDERPVKILLSRIDLGNRRFKISRNYIDDRLRRSIKYFGVIEPPVLKRDDDKYLVVFGFNRLRALEELNDKTVDAIVVDNLDQEIYIRSALLKCLRNESGPIGRIKFLSILKKYFKIELERLYIIARQALSIPEEYIENDSLQESVDQLPEAIKDYIDYKDVNYRVIKNIVSLPGSAVSEIARWIEFSAIKVNLFKGIIDMLRDIYIRDEKSNPLEGIKRSNFKGRKKWDEYIYNQIFKMRYPEYSSLKKKADDIVKYFSSSGIRIDYPEYFEGDTLNINISMRKSDDPKVLKEKIKDIDIERLNELLALL